MEDDVRTASLLKRILGVEKVVIEGFDFEGDDVVIKVRLHKRQQRRCSRCGRRCCGHDNGRGRRRWRVMDFGTVMVWLEAEAPRVRCPRHGVVIARVTWARTGSGFTHNFEDQVAWLSTNTSQSAVGALMRISWRTVGRCLRRVVDERRADIDLLDGLSRIGIDETSYRRGHRYLTVVVCHDTGRRLPRVRRERPRAHDTGVVLPVSVQSLTVRIASHPFRNRIDCEVATI